ncbi:glycogen/starch synthase [soil metagenome]
MRILMISPEGPPLARASALVDVIEALPRELRARGHEIGIVLPYYRAVRENTAIEHKDTGITVDVQVGPKNYVAEYLTGRTAGGVQLFYVRCDEFFDREGIYREHGVAYEDNSSRFIFFSKAALELARRLAPSPEILHVHDWATALVPVLVHAGQMPFRTVLTIHHLADQGNFWGLDFALTNLPERYFTLRSLEYFGRMNLLKGGVLFADRITTVSERFRREMMTAEGGCGLDIVMRENAHRISGILNGADYERWNPATDSLLPSVFDAASLDGKLSCRNALLEQMGLAPAKVAQASSLHSSGGSKLEARSTTVFGMVTRLVPEKGFDVLMPVLDRLLSDDVRLIILGEGDPAYERALAIAARKYPAKFAYRESYDERLAHLIEAGADVTLIPSQIEPSGLSAMYSLKYGALPVARATGGIQEIIRDYDPVGRDGYAFLYYDVSAEAFWDAIKRGRELFHQTHVWAQLVQRAMEQDFSWQAAASQYEQLYASVLPQAQVHAA